MSTTPSVNAELSEDYFKRLADVQPRDLPPELDLSSLDRKIAALRIEHQQVVFAQVDFGNVRKRLQVTRARFTTRACRPCHLHSRT